MRGTTSVFVRATILLCSVVETFAICGLCEFRTTEANNTYVFKNVNVGLAVISQGVGNSSDDVNYVCEVLVDV
jgi:hypothetical protein